MKMTYFVNTMFLLEGAQTSVLCDPWITTGLKSLTGLYNFPELQMTMDDLTEIKPDFIYISHTHADHYDPQTLAVFDRNTPVLVSWYKNNFTAKAVKRLGFNDVRICPQGDYLELNGNDKVWIEPSAVYSAVDSLGVFQIDNHRLLNANDCVYDQKQCEDLVRRIGKIDIACCPSGFQGPYPAFYTNLSEDERKAEAAKKKLYNFEMVLGYLRSISPDYFVSLTGGAAYGGDKALLMKYCGIGTTKEVIEFVEQSEVKVKALKLSESCSYDFETGVSEGQYIAHSYDTQLEYLKRIANIPVPFDKGGLFYVEPSEWIDLTPLFVSARKRQSEWQSRLNIESDSVFYIDTNQGWVYRFCLADETVQKLDAPIDDAYEKFTVPYGLMVGLLTRHYNYSNVKTQFIWFYRQPDVFNPDLHILMSYLQL